MNPYDGCGSIILNEKVIISGDLYSNRIYFWNFKSGKKIKTLSGHDYGIFSLAINQGKHYLISGSFDSTIKLWNYISGK